MEQVEHIIAVSSGKGGVGKSTVSVNLAVSLSKDGFRVGLLDADLYGPNIPTMLGVTEQPKIVEADGVEYFLPPTGQTGIKTMSMGFLTQPDQPAIWRGPMLHNVLSQFAKQIDWGSLDFLIVDLPPGTGDVQLSLAQLLSIRAALVVTTPQEVSLQDVRKAVHMWEKVKVPVIGVVENMSYFECGSCSSQHEIFGKGGGANLAKKFKTELLAQIPLVPEVRRGGDEGRPYIVDAKTSEVSKLFERLAKNVSAIAKEMKAAPHQPSDIVQIGKFD